MADSKVSALTEDAAPSLDDNTYLVDDMAGTPDSRRVTLQSILDAFVAAGSGLEDLPAAAGDMDTTDTAAGVEDGSPVQFTQAQIVSATRVATVLAAIAASAGNMDIDDVVLGVEDGTVVAFSRLKLLAGIAAAAGTPDADDVLYGLEDGVLAAFTRAQVISGLATLASPTFTGDVVVPDANAATEAMNQQSGDTRYLVKSFGTTTQVIQNTAARHFNYENDNTFATNDIQYELYLNNTDTAAVFQVSTLAGVLLTFALGPGGSTAVDTPFVRIAANKPGFTNPGAVNGAFPARLMSNLTAVGNVTTGEDSLQSYSVAANTITAASTIRARWKGTFANNADTKTLRIKWNGTTIATAVFPTSVAGSWHAELEATRDGVAAYCSAVIHGNGAVVVGNASVASTFTGALVALATGDATSTNDIVSEILTVDLEQSAATA